jgi:hypothetical protein
MDHYRLEFEDKTFKLRIRTRDHAELGKMLGDSVIGILGDQNKAMDVFAYLPAILYVSLKPFAGEHGKYSYEGTCDLIDRMVDAGWSTEQFVELVTKIAEVTGFFPKDAAKITPQGMIDLSREINQPTEEETREMSEA